MAGSDTRIDDGHSTIYLFEDFPDVILEEKTVKPPGLDGGGANDVTTMRNTRFRTKSPKKLMTVTPATGTCAYRTNDLATIVSMMQVNQRITVQFPDGTGWRFWGWLDKFEPQDVQEGAQPEANFTIETSNHNNSLVEVGPEAIANASTTTTTTSP